MTEAAVNEAEILTETRGHLAVITLNRPRAMNALNLNMVQLLQQVLNDYAEDTAITAVMLRGAGERGFCSGGDVVTLHRQATEDPKLAAIFFRAEYQLDYTIATYPKPVIALMSGLVLGGGVGLAGPSSHRVVTDTTRLGMPETGIGFSPDVAGSYYLAQAPGLVGHYMATTGVHITGADALFAGLGDFYVPDARHQELVAALEKVEDPFQITPTIQQFTTEPEKPSQLALDAEWIDRVYDADNIEQIISNLRALAEARADHPAGRALRKIQSNSPTGVKVALEAVKKAKNLSIGETLQMDFRTTMNAAFGHDLVEGIRAQLIDKDRNPSWNPASFAEVSEERVASFFQPVPDVPDLELND